MNKKLSLMIVSFLVLGLAFVSAQESGKSGDPASIDQSKAQKCDPELGLGNTVQLYIKEGAEKKWKDTRFDNTYHIKVLEREGNTVKFEINGEQTGFVRESERISIAGLNLYIYEARSIYEGSDRGAHFCVSERPEAKSGYQAEQLRKQLEETQKELQETKGELEETKGMLARIVDFLKRLFGFGE